MRRQRLIVSGLCAIVVADTLDSQPRLSQSKSAQGYPNSSFVNESNYTITSDSTVHSTCSFRGPDWDPLQDCFPSFTTSPEVKKQILCKLKQDLNMNAWYKAAPPSFLQSHRHQGQSLLKNTSRDASNQSSWLTCAVVSNSGVLRHHNHGPTIDKASRILRFNDAPLANYSAFVGEREDTRVVNQQFPYRVLEGAISQFSFVPGTMVGLIPFGTETPGINEFMTRYPSTPVYVLDMALIKAFEVALRSIYKAPWFDEGQGGVSFMPTTGSVGVLSAMASCDEVMAFGMAATPNAQHYMYHYYIGGYESERKAWQKKKAHEGDGWHKTFMAEKDLWRRISKNSAEEIDKTDVAVIPGFSQVHCPASTQWSHKKLPLEQHS